MWYTTFIIQPNLSNTSLYLLNGSGIWLSMASTHCIKFISVYAFSPRMFGTFWSTASNSTVHCLSLCRQDIVVFPHGFSWAPPKAMSLACDGFNGFVPILLYLSFEMTLHWTPVSNLNVVFCLLSKIVTFQSLEPRLVCIIPMNMSSASVRQLCSIVLSWVVCDNWICKLLQSGSYGHTRGILHHMQDRFGWLCVYSHICYNLV